MDFVAMIGKLAAWWLVGENRRVGFLIGAAASLLICRACPQCRAAWPDCLMCPGLLHSDAGLLQVEQ